MAIGKFLERLGTERVVRSNAGFSSLVSTVSRRTGQPQGDRPELQRGVRRAIYQGNTRKGFK